MPNPSSVLYTSNVSDIHHHQLFHPITKQTKKNKNIINVNRKSWKEMCPQSLIQQQKCILNLWSNNRYVSPIFDPTTEMYPQSLIQQQKCIPNLWSSNRNVSSIFDPTTEINNVPLNWTRTVIGLIMTPTRIWLIPSRNSIIINLLIINPLSAAPPASCAPCSSRPQRVAALTEACQGRLWSSPGVVTNTAGSKWASSFVINHSFHERGSSVKDRQTDRQAKRKVFASHQFVRSCRMMIGKQLQCHAVSWLALMRTFCYFSCLFAPWRHAANSICTFKPNVTSCAVFILPLQHWLNASNCPRISYK